jgi:hypothetical protein
LAALGIGHVSLDAIEAGVGQRQFDRPFAGGFPQQRHIAPKGDGHGVFAGVGGDHFLPEPGGFAQIGPEQGARTGRQILRQPQAETDAVTDEAQEAFAGRGSHHQFIHARTEPFIVHRKRKGNRFDLPLSGDNAAKLQIELHFICH